LSTADRRVDPSRFNRFARAIRNTMASPPESLRIATRQSPLALWQARWVAERLGAAGCRTELIPLSSVGDEDPRPIGAATSSGVFTKRIQEAVLEGSADLAVHSLKDLPTEPFEHLEVWAVPTRGDVRDCLVLLQRGDRQSDHPLLDLPNAARLGTGSRRRAAQSLWWRSDLHVEPIRGNVATRLRRLEQPSACDAILLACAGLERLGLSDSGLMIRPLAIEHMLPAPGQGALAVEGRRNQPAVRQWVREVLNDYASEQSTVAERGLLRTLRGGCLAPIGAHARAVGEQLCLSAVVLSVDGRRRMFAEAWAPITQAESLGQHLAERLLGEGADRLLAEAR
jgi:hydroxymethylbilane synthase